MVSSELVYFSKKYDINTMKSGMGVERINIYLLKMFRKHSEKSYCRSLKIPFD